MSPLINVSLDCRTVNSEAPLVGGVWRDGEDASLAVFLPPCNHLQLSIAEREARFWARIQRGAADACWPWQASCTKDGYGQVALGKLPDGTQVNDYAHRVVWRLMRGPIPKGLVVRHECDNPPCCNLRHLLLGTQAENIADAQRQGKYRGEKPHLWLLPADVRPTIIAECLTGPRGTIARLARAHGVTVQHLSMAVRRARERAA